MKVFLFISKEKKHYQMYLPYFEALHRTLDITDHMADADTVYILGAWTIEGARLARKSRKMGIPYIVCPLGDLSERNSHTPHIKRSFQQALYQKKMYQQAALIIATTPMEETFLKQLGWNNNLQLIRYFGYSHLTTERTMAENIAHAHDAILKQFEQRKAEAIAAQTQDAIIAQILQIKSRMPHENIPHQYLSDLYTLLYADNYDEDILCENIAKLKLTHYAASVFQAMTEKTGLTEGFMPLPAKKGSKSKEILKYVK